MLGWLRCTGRPDAARVFWTAGRPETSSRSVRCYADANICIWKSYEAAEPTAILQALLYYWRETARPGNWADTDTSAWGQGCFLRAARSSYPVTDFQDLFKHKRWLRLDFFFTVVCSSWNHHVSVESPDTQKIRHKCMKNQTKNQCGHTLVRTS